mgnify:CR=1 FL=1
MAPPRWRFHEAAARLEPLHQPVADVLLFMLALLLLQGHTQWQRARQAGAVESKGRARQGWSHQLPMLPRLLLDLRRELGRTVRLTLELLGELRHLSFQRAVAGGRAHHGLVLVGGGKFRVHAALAFMVYSH